MRVACRCIHCGALVKYDPERGAELNYATGCTKSVGGLHACVVPLSLEEVYRAGYAHGTEDRSYDNSSDVDWSWNAFKTGSRA